jgi:opacity protein-like surface antigen
MKKFLAFSALALSAFATQAQTYGELAYVAATIKDSDTKISPSAVRGTVGYEYSPNLAFESALILGAKSDSLVGNLATVKIKFDPSIAFLVKPKMKLTNDLEIFAKVGYGRIRISASSQSESAKAADNHVVYGMGLTYSINKSTSLNLDYISYNSEDSTKINGLGVGLGYKF